MTAAGGAVPIDLVEALARADYGRGLDHPAASWGRASEEVRAFWRHRATLLAEVAAVWAAHREAASVELLSAVQSLAVPTRGPVLFVLRDLSVRWLDPAIAAALVARLRELTQPLAPERSAVVVLGHDMSLELLSEEYLAALGLNWIDS